jgi:phage tail-like protein
VIVAITSRTTEPYRNYRFLVSIDAPFYCMSFRKVSGLKATTEVIEWREGGDAPTPRKFPGVTTYDAVTLERGMCNDADMWNWVKDVLALDAAGGSPNVRRNVSVTLLNHQGKPVVRWVLEGCWPSEYSLGDMDAGGNEVLVESMVLQYTRFRTEFLGD